jgi:glycine/D-amino acid oxidase-like deaminating enzyme
VEEETMADRTDVIVVGGGILGCSAAYHLRTAGIGEVLLLERDDVAQATTSAGAGFLAVWGAGHVPAWRAEERAIECYGLDFYQQIAALGYDIGYKRNGNLWAATTHEAWTRHVALIADSEAVPDKRVLEPREVEAITGIIPRDAVVGGVLHPGGSQVTAPKAARAVADLFARAGGAIEVRRPVTRLRVGNGRVTGVETARGTVEADRVVLAAGAWTNALLRPLGLRLAQAPLTATRIVTEPLGVPTTMPTLVLPEFNDIWLREEKGGLLWGCAYEAAPRYDLVDREVPERFDQLALDGLFETMRVGVAASVAIPVLARYRSVTMAQAAPCYTADRRAMLGPVPDVEGLYVVGGDNESGITHGPGFGKLIAELLTDGRTALTDITAFRPDRVGDGEASDAAVVRGMHTMNGAIVLA